MAGRGERRPPLTSGFPLPGPRAAGTLALLIVLLAIGAAVAGTAAGARVATEALPEVVDTPPQATESAAEAELGASSNPPGRPAVQAHSVRGRVVGKRGNLVRVRPPGGTPMAVQVLPRTVIRRAGEKADLAAIQRGDRVVVVGRLDENGVLQARGIVARPPPPRPPAADESAAPAPDAPSPEGAAPAHRPALKLLSPLDRAYCEPPAAAEKLARGTPACYADRVVRVVEFRGPGGAHGPSTS
jgi:hypothetical protein